MTRLFLLPLGLLALWGCAATPAPTATLACAAEASTRTADLEDEMVIVRRSVTPQAASYYVYAGGETFLCSVDRSGRVGLTPI